MTDSNLDNGKSFSLTKKVPTADQRQEAAESPLSWQEQAYGRLKVLYGVSKLLSTFESIETTFPQILNMCAGAFPFVTGALIEKKGKDITTSMWHAENVTTDQIALAINSAKESFVYLTGASESDSVNLRSNAMSSQSLLHVQAQTQAKATDRSNYIALPLHIDRLPAFGVLQLEGSSPIGEREVEFVDALCDLVAIAIDRHYRVQAEGELRDKEALESSTKLSLSQTTVLNLEMERELRENFVSLLSHDLRTPLSAAKISAQLIQREPGVPADSQAFAARIVYNLSRADQMISDLLDANRIRSGEKLPLKIEFLNLTSLVKRTLEELATIHGDRFVFTAPDSVEGYWDQNFLRRTIENLSNNAIKYGSPDTPVNLTLKQDLDTVTIEVQNKGNLISPEDQKSLFQQFKRSQHAQRSGKKGWGIGLTLVRGVAEAHGGNITVSSDAARGTVFTLTLPMDPRAFLAKGQ